jgi:hypothetical protein
MVLSKDEKPQALLESHGMSTQENKMQLVKWHPASIVFSNTGFKRMLLSKKLFDSTVSFNTSIKTVLLWGWHDASSIHTPLSTNCLPKTKTGLREVEEEEEEEEVDNDYLGMSSW